MKLTGVEQVERNVRPDGTSSRADQLSVSKVDSCIKSPEFARRKSGCQGYEFNITRNHARVGTTESNLARFLHSNGGEEERHLILSEEVSSEGSVDDCGNGGMALNSIFSEIRGPNTMKDMQS